MKLNLMSGLAFVPTENVIDSWEELVTNMQPWILQQTGEIQHKIDDFITYFETNYIGKKIANIRREPRVVPIYMWNVRMRTLEHYGRTDNEVEGFHMKVRFSVGAQFPNLWKFLKSLQGIQAETEKILAELNSGVMGKKQRPQYIITAQRVYNITSSWDSRQNLISYLEGLINNFMIR